MLTHFTLSIICATESAVLAQEGKPRAGYDIVSRGLSTHTLETRGAFSTRFVKGRGE